MNRVASSALLALTLALPLTACTGTEATSSEDDLTSIRGQARELRFEGRVFVSRGASDDAILREVHRQTRTAFGPLREQGIGVNNRELKGVDPATFVKREVEIVDTEEGGESEAMLEVRYTYVDDAVAPKRLSGRSTVPSAVLRPDYQSEADRVLEECTTNDEHARDFASSLWYVFDPSLSRCATAIRAEQDRVEASRAKLPDGEGFVSRVDAERLYLPITVALGPDATNRGESYPEYDRLFSGGVDPDAVVFSLINGLIDHDPNTALEDDTGYGEWLDTLDEVLDAHPSMDVVAVEGDVDLERYELASGKSVSLSFRDIIALENGSAPSGLSYDERDELEGLVAERVADKWITLEMPVTVTVGDEAPRDFAVRILAYFGHAEGVGPYKYAIKNSDVFLYNGHSMIGSGPLDPRNFSASDFPPSYQILFIDGCVSYNYYEADYIPLKEGGTKNLDLVTNALESPAWRSGYALGRFIATMLDGADASWLELLESAEATGSGLRVVDGELDNGFDPAATKVAFEAR